MVLGRGVTTAMEMRCCVSSVNIVVVICLICKWLIQNKDKNNNNNKTKTGSKHKEEKLMMVAIK